MGQKTLWVLLVEDDQENLLNLLAKYLHQLYGCKVDTAINAAAALTLLEDAQGTYDVALIDDLLRPDEEQQPKPMAVSLVKELKARYPAIEIIVFIEQNRDSALEILQAGAYHYLTKPLNFDELELVIQSAVEHRQLKKAAHEKQILEQLMIASTVLLNGQNLQEVLDTILKGVQAIGFDRACLYLLSEDDQTMVGQAQVGMTTDFVGHTRPIAIDRSMKVLLTEPHPHVFKRENSQPPPFEDVLDRKGVNQWACIPLILHEKVIGKLSLDNKFSQRPIAESELGLVILFAAQAAAAIENARLREREKKATQRAEQRTRMLQTIQKISTVINSLLELDKILEETCRAVVELFEVDHSGLIRFDPDYEQGQVLAEYPDLGTCGVTISIRGVKVEEELIASKEPLNLSHLTNRTVLGPVGHIFDKFDIRSILLVPVVLKEQVLGSFSLDAIGRTRDFTEEEIELCQILAAQVAIAIENAQLFQQTHRRALALEGLHQTSLEITGSPHIPKLVSSILERAVELLQAKGGALYLLEQFGTTVKIVAVSHLPDHFVGMIMELGNSVVGQVIKTKAPLVMSDYRNWSDRLRQYDQYGFTAVISAPIIWQDKIWGAIAVHDDVEGKTFNQENLKLLSHLGNLAAVALGNAELVTRESEQKDHFVRLIASSPNAVIALDQLGNITSFNEQAQKILKYPPEDVLHKSVDFLYDDPLEPRRVGRLLHNSARGTLTNHETFVRSQEGECIPIRLAATWLYDAQKNKIGSVGYFEDLRIIRDTEKRLDLLLKASNTVAQAENLTDSLQSLAEMIVTFLGIGFCRCFLLDEGHQILLAKAAYPPPFQSNQLDWDPKPEQQITLAEWPLLAEVLAGWEPELLRIDDPQHHLFLVERSRRLGLKQNIQALFLVPLKAGNKVVGLLALAELRPWAQAPFSLQKQELAVAIADQVATLINRIHLLEITERRRELLIALDEASRHIRGEKETFKLLQEVVRLAAELVGCTAGGLYINYPQLKELKLEITYELPIQLIGNQLAHREGLMGLVAQTGQSKVIQHYSDWNEREDILEAYHFKTVAAVPLKQDGEVEAVLFVASPRDLTGFTPADLDILERFATHAAMALQTSRLMDRDQRQFRLLTILHKVSDYIQAARDLNKILHVVLTGITANYGLCFNRAGLLLLDKRREQLEGYIGIGHLNEAKARVDWERDQLEEGIFDFEKYLKSLEQNALSPTPIDARIRQLRLPVRATNFDLFSKVILDGEPILVTTQDDLTKLSDRFIEAFEPALPLIIVPLLARDQVIGLLVADNKFTLSPITLEDVDSLLTFANTAAVAIDNIKLLHETEVARERFRSFYKASNMLVSSLNTERILQDIVEQTRAAAEASRVSISLINEMGQAKNLVTTDPDQQFSAREVIRHDGLSAEVMCTGKPVIIEDITRQREKLNPRMFEDNNIRAALCLPLSLRGERIGVMWLHYSQPHYHFSETEIEALLLYVNQAVIAYDGTRRMKELEYMREAAEALASVAELPQVLKQIVQNARKILRADSASTLFYNASQDQFTVEGTVAAGMPTGTLAKFLGDKSWESPTDFVILEQQWVGVGDIEDKEKYPFLGQLTQDFLRFIEAQSFQGIALTVDDDRLGILYVNYLSVPI